MTEQLLLEDALLDRVAEALGGTGTAAAARIRGLEPGRALSVLLVELLDEPALLG